MELTITNGALFGVKLVDAADQVSIHQGRSDPVLVTSNKAHVNRHTQRRVGLAIFEEEPTRGFPKVRERGKVDVDVAEDRAVSASGVIRLLVRLMDLKLDTGVALGSTNEVWQALFGREETLRSVWRLDGEANDILQLLFPGHRVGFDGRDLRHALPFA